MTPLETRNPSLLNMNNYSTIHSGDTVYIAGPMTGYPMSNYPAFNAMEKYLTSLYDCKIINPAANFGGDPNLPRENYMQVDLSNLTTYATAVVFLPNWEKSQGAIKEYLTASELKLKMFDHQVKAIPAFNQKLKLRKVSSHYELST